MELLFELFLTILLSLILTTLLIKLFSMNPFVVTDNDDQFTEDGFQMDKFQRVLLKDEQVKLEEFQGESKSMVEFYNVVGVDTEVNDHEDITLENEIEREDLSSRLEENDQEERKVREIPIESVEEVEIEGEKDEKMGDWIEIERRDFEELPASL